MRFGRDEGCGSVGKDTMKSAEIEASPDKDSLMMDSLKEEDEERLIREEEDRLKREEEEEERVKRDEEDRVKREEEDRVKAAKKKPV